MTNTNHSLLEESKQKLERVREDIVGQALKIRRELELKQGALKDESMDAALEIGEQALSRVASIADKAGLSPDKTEFLRTGVADLATKRAELNQPGLEGYDSMNVKSVLAEISDLEPNELMKIARYEAQNKKRKTIIREIERRLA